ncbi:hypothetical protein IGI04_034458 [Brassica rapa subsp. trilocularis]|uniref:Uncharacterized protein n=1 Tax=Brassica rapa subsp. trilocularis TaxID=1813537 RepID=A0ABQ7L8U5_BRACM|nr:hypothetical protein IGI04_034458 [Brassica rapa subsp. trilocularis]
MNLDIFNIHTFLGEVISKQITSLCWTGASHPATFETLVVSLGYSATLSITPRSIIETPTPEPAQKISTASTSQKIFTGARDGACIFEPDLGSNKFASLINMEEEGEDTVESDETESMGYLTPFGKRILRERPVKPSTKAREMHCQPTSRGRGNQVVGTVVDVARFSSYDRVIFNWLQFRMSFSLQLHSTCICTFWSFCLAELESENCGFIRVR